MSEWYGDPPQGWHSGLLPGRTGRAIRLNKLETPSQFTARYAWEQGGFLKRGGKKNYRHGNRRRRH